MEAHIPGPPYPPTHAGLGGVPSTSVDVPIACVFLVLFIISAAVNMTILQVNLKRGHKFILSGVMFGFSMARTVTMIMRIVWAYYPHDIQIAMAAMIFTNAGVVLLFIVNLVFTQRLLRAAHPDLGWHRSIHYAFIGLYVLVVLFVAMIITVIVQSFYTLNPNTKRIDRDVQLTVLVVFTVISFLPIPIVIGGLIIPRQHSLDKFGEGRHRTKIAILLISTTLLCLGASFRCGVNFLPPRPITDPAWYDSKACYWIFYFTVEIISIYMYIIARVDKRFWVPNKSKAYMDYSGREDVKGQGLVKRVSNKFVEHLKADEVFFNHQPPLETVREEKGETVDIKSDV